MDLPEGSHFTGCSKRERSKNLTSVIDFCRLKPSFLRKLCAGGIMSYTFQINLFVILFFKSEMFISSVGLRCF